MGAGAGEKRQATCAANLPPFRAHTSPSPGLFSEKALALKFWIERLPPGARQDKPNRYQVESAKLRGQIVSCGPALSGVPTLSENPSKDHRAQRAPSSVLRQSIGRIWACSCPHQGRDSGMSQGVKKCRDGQRVGVVVWAFMMNGSRELPPTCWPRSSKQYCLVNAEPCEQRNAA